jgi:uncharacterized tellurite resistance protein B-like protein
MDFAPGEAKAVHERDVLVGAAMLLGEIDGAMDERAWNVLAHLLLPYSSDPEAEVERVRSAERARELVDTSASWLAANTGEERFEAIRKLAHVAAVDGRYSDQELGLLHALAEQLGVPRKAADSILYDVLAEHLQGQAIEGGPVPKLGRRSSPG